MKPAFLASRTPKPAQKKRTENGARQYLGVSAAIAEKISALKKVGDVTRCKIPLNLFYPLYPTAPLGKLMNATSIPRRRNGAMKLLSRL